MAIDAGLVSIHCDAQLWQLVDRRKRSDFRVLVHAIYQSHRAQYGKELRISERSFLLEIYGHIYADYYLLRYARFFRALLPSRVYDRLLRSCEDIDCGDRQRDPNRIFWDILSFMDWAIYPFFSRNISRKYAK